jgi:hypothetical protein
MSYSNSQIAKKKDENFKFRTTYNNREYVQPKRIDVNILLNRIRINEQKRKKENLILLGVVSTIITVTGIFITF